VPAADASLGGASHTATLPVFGRVTVTDGRGLMWEYEAGGSAGRRSPSLDHGGRAAVAAAYQAWLATGAASRSCVLFVADGAVDEFGPGVDVVDMQQAARTTGFQARSFPARRRRPGARVHVAHRFHTRQYGAGRDEPLGVAGRAASDVRRRFL